ncbi:MAG TPA: PIN domain-containing protein [Polyangia bacterium]
MPGPLVIFDTSVLVSALRSRRGASFALLERLGSDRFDVAVSVPLALEYEDAMLRHRGPLSVRQVGDIIDYVCSVARQQQVFFLWRPFLRDANDDMVVEVAVAAGAHAIVTHNRRDFVGAERLGLKVWSPQQMLERIRR